MGRLPAESTASFNYRPTPALKRALYRLMLRKGCDGSRLITHALLTTYPELERLAALPEKPPAKGVAKVGA